MLKPIKSIDVATHEVNVRWSIVLLEQKAYSHQWNIPDETHEQVMQQLKTKSFPEVYSEKIDVLMWDAKDICDFVESCKDFTM